MATPAPRVLCKGAISFGLVHIPVALHAGARDNSAVTQAREHLSGLLQRSLRGGKAPAARKTPVRRKPA